MDAEGKLALPSGKAPKMKVPTELIPCCPVCGAPMSMNLRTDSSFVEDEGWHQAESRYKREIPLLADDRRKPEGSLCLREPWGSLGAGTDPGALHLHQRGYWGGVNKNNKKIIYNLYQLLL